MKKLAIIYRTRKWVQTNCVSEALAEFNKGAVLDIVDRFNNYLVKKGSVTLYGKRYFNSIGG